MTPATLATFFPVQSCSRCTKQFVVGSVRDNPICSACSTQLELAKERLHKAAVAIGGLLIDGEDPSWSQCIEFEQSAVGYVKALRGEQVAK